MFTTKASSSRTAGDIVQEMIENVGFTTTTTKAGWCLREGLVHVMTVDNGRLLPLVQSQGPPSFYHSLESCRHKATDSSMLSTRTPKNCFQSLCRIIAGQQLAGKAAQAIWKRLLETTQNDLTPKTVVSLAGPSGVHLETAIQKPAGLSRAKSRAIWDLSLKFQQGELTEDFLTNPQTSELTIREALLNVKGLGPWSCDMFLMFHLERPNVFPFGDLGVRKGVAKTFDVKNGKGTKGSMCQKKDLERALSLVKPYLPYQSLLAYYMWKAADTKDVYAEVDAAEQENGVEKEATATPSRGRKRARVVTPS